MNPKEQILKFIQSIYKNMSESASTVKRDEAENSSTENEIIRELFDGMSTGTARIIIEREVS